MKTSTGFFSSFLMFEDEGKRFHRLKPKVKYVLPPIEKGSFFSAFGTRKVKQHVCKDSLRKNKDVITFL